jgi:chromosome segregation ATPase
LGRDDPGEDLLADYHRLRGDVRALQVEVAAIRALMAETDKRYAAIDAANKEAVKAALTTVEKAADRLEVTNKEQRAQANEWRATLNDVVGRLLSRTEYDREREALRMQLDGVLSSIADLRESRSAQQGKATNVVYLVGLFIVALQLALHFLK